MEQKYYDGLIESIEEDNNAYARERADIRRSKKSSVRNLKLRKQAIRKLYARLAIAGGITLAVLCHDKVFDAVNSAVDAFIEWDNGNFQDEVDKNSESVYDVTGRTQDDIMNGPVDYDELREQYEAEQSKGMGR